MTESRPEKGFSLVELVIAMGITSILMVGIVTLVISQSRAYRMHEQILEMHQRTRAAITQAVREIRMAGYHAMGDLLINNLDAWVAPSRIPSEPVPVNFDANPKITSGQGTEPDMITFLSDFETDCNPSAVSGAVNAGAVRLPLDRGVSYVAKEYLPGDLIHIGEASEYARVMEVDGNTLVIDTNPAIPGNQGLAGSYPPGTRVGEISVVTYAVFNDANDPDFKRHEKGRPILRRAINNRGFQPVALDIQDFSIAAMGNGSIDLTITGRTAGPDRNHPENNGYRTYPLSQRVKVRNAVAVSGGSDCTRPAQPGGFVIATGFDEDAPCSVDLSWEPVTLDDEGRSLAGGPCEVSGYRVFYGDRQGLYTRSMDVGNQLSCTVDLSGIDTCTWYLAVSAVNGAGAGPKSREISISDSPGQETALPPAVPSGLSAVQDIDTVTDNRILVSWEASHGCDLAGYTLFRSTFQDGPFIDSVHSGLLDKMSAGYTDTGLKGCVVYYYRLQSVDRCGNTSGLSGTASAQVLEEQAPRPPMDVHVKQRSTTYTVTWVLSPDDPGSGCGAGSACDVQGYRVYAFSGDSLNAEEVYTLDAGKSAVAIVAGSTEMTYAVSAVDYCGNESGLAREGDCSTLPEVMIVSPGSMQACSGTLQVTGTASAPGNRPVSRVDLCVDDGGLQRVSGTEQWSQSIDTTRYKDGLHEILARVLDSDECEGQASVSVQFRNGEPDLPVISELTVCWDRQADGHLYLRVSVRQDTGEPVTEALVTCSLPWEPIVHLGNGWYGGEFEAGCVTGGTGWARSLDSYTESGSLPDVVTVTVETGQGTVVAKAPVIRDE